MMIQTTKTYMYVCHKILKMAPAGIDHVQSWDRHTVGYCYPPEVHRISQPHWSEGSWHAMFRSTFNLLVPQLQWLHRSLAYSLYFTGLTRCSTIKLASGHTNLSRSRSVKYKLHFESNKYRWERESFQFLITQYSTRRRRCWKVNY